MWLDTFGRTEEQDKEFFSQLGAVQPPKKEEPGLFTGTGKALAYAIPHGLLGTASLLDDFSVKKLSQLYDLPNLQNEDALSEPIEIKKDSLEIAIQKAKEDAKYHRLKVKKNWTPNPETTGAAAQMIHGITSTMFKALGYSVIAGGNPYVASGLFGADMGLIERGTLIDKGVDENTANLAGLASGVANAVGMVLPASIGMSYKTSALFGGTANIVTDIGEKASIKAILDNADYKKISGEYDPFDPTNLGVSAGVGVLFGLAGAKGAKVRARKAKEAEEERLRLLKEKELAEEKEAEARAREAEKGITEEAKKTQETKAPPKINPEILNSIQNRDRSSKNSVAQMQIISQNPDFNKLAEGRTLQTGTPVISYVPNSTKLVLGKNVQVSTNEAGDRVTMQYAVIESNSVLTSHGVLGDVHKGYTNPKVQRARAIAGNGRVAGVNDAYKHRTADKYRKELTEQIADYGIDPAEVAKMKRPMLVRIMDEKDITLETGQESNRSGIQGLDPVEQAKQDAVNVDVENIVFNKDGTISQKSISEFVFKNPDKTGMVDPRGNIIADNAAQRMRTAVFSGAYRDTTLISRFLANGEKERKILDALLQVAPEIVKLRKIGGEYDYSNDAVEAAADVFQTRKETKGLEREENTISLLQSTPEQEFFKKILLSKHPEALKNVIQRMLEVAEQERLSADGGIVQPLTHSELSENVFKEFADVDLTPDIESILARSEEFKRSITSDTVDAAMELNSARVITQDQPSGPNGNINKSLQDEATAREQIDDGKKVEVTGEGVDPEVMDNNVSSFITRFVKELVGAGADKKIAGMNARIIDAFFSTMGVRLGKSRKEIEAEYELKVQKGEEPQANSYAQQKTAEQKLAEESKNWESFVDSLTSKPTNHVRMLTQTPIVMHLVGADFKELYATPHFFDRIFENKDGSKTTFTKEEIKKIPSALADPVAIFDQENGRKLFLLDFTTKSKAPILVPIEFNAQGEIATVNLAISCFAKEKDGKPKWGWINSESLKGKELYVNKEKLSSMEPYSGANSLRVLQSRITESVLTEADLVKERQKYPGYYQTQSEAPLVTVHNLSEENLNKAMDLGGLAVPSLGITKRDTAYADFGDISLIGTKDMADPRKGTPVFSQDAYTQTFPEPVWEKSVKPEGAKEVSREFEAKPQRAVKFNEFAGAVVPKKTSPETIARLEKEGIKVAVYDETLPDGRQKAITELTDSLQKERDDILYQNGRKGIYTPGERVITLLQSADESTFVHESGHYFLDVLTDIGSRERVPKQIKDDIQTLMDWFGVKDLEEWNSLSFEEKRQYHEKFARGFEQYLREGKAPSSTLEKVFKSFKDWLMKIYKSAKDLDVELSPEVRSVYDRLLATDEQIKQRRAEEAGVKVRPDESSTVRAETSPAEAITEQQVSEAIDTLPVPEQAKGLLKEAIGIEDTSGQQQATGEKHPHSGIPTEEEFVRQSLETDSVRDPDAFIVDENGNEISLKDYLAEQDRIAEREIKDANAMGVAAECMWRQGAFDEI